MSERHDSMPQRISVEFSPGIHVHYYLGGSPPVTDLSKGPVAGFKELSESLKLENTRLKEQNERQAKTITESDIALENAAVRLRWFQAKVTELLEQARIRSACTHPLRSCFRPEPGTTHTFKPKTMIMDARRPEYITLTF
jgi:hypothetical protein